MCDIFQIPDFKFPKEFLWGSSTAGHQIEGENTDSNCWHSEQAWPLDFKAEYSQSGKACNHWNMVDEDIALMKEIELQAYRMSVEWSRIEPRDGEFCQDAIDHYLYELNALKEQGIKIFLTMNHVSCPQWFAQLGGMWEEKNLKYFERFLEKTVPLFAPYADAWNVLNEFNMGIGESRMKAKMNQLRFHALGYHIIKKYSDKPVSSAHALVMYDPVRRYDKFDQTTADFFDLSCNEFFFHAMRTGEVVAPLMEGFYDPDIKGTVDFWAINIYNRSMMDGRKAWGTGEKYQHKKFDLINMPFYLNEFYPETIIHQLSRLTDLPVYITENGCSCDNDDWRIVWITQYLSALHEAMEKGVDVRGYIYWSLMDNYEWTSFLPRFGLIDVDFETFERKLKPSAYFFRDIIRNDGFSQEILRKYLHTHPTELTL